MRTTFFLITIFALVASVLGEWAIDNCKKCKMHPDPVRLHCDECVAPGKDGQDGSKVEYWSPPDLHLDGCFWNDKGTLQRQGGGWTRSCGYIFLFNNGTMKADCDDGKGGKGENWIDLKDGWIYASQVGMVCGNTWFSDWEP